MSTDFLKCNRWKATLKTEASNVYRTVEKIKYIHFESKKQNRYVCQNVNEINYLRIDPLVIF